MGRTPNGKIFSENVTAPDVSQSGARLGGVRSQIKVDEIVGLTYGKSKVHFRMKWAAAAGSPSEGQIGLLNEPGEAVLGFSSSSWYCGR